MTMEAKTTEKTVEPEIIRPLETRPAELVPAPDRDGSAEVIDPRHLTDDAFAALEIQIQNTRKMMALAIKLTSPSQWTVFTGTDKTGKQRRSVYPTGGAADRILRQAFGFTFQNKSVVTKGVGEDMTATATIDVCRADGSYYETFRGERSIGGYIGNEADLRKGAIENAKSVALRDLLGLRFLSPSDYKELGLDLATLPTAEFESHGEAGAHNRVRFGRDKGKALDQVEDLGWYRDAVAKGVADPAKAKYKASGESHLRAIDAEIARRRGPAPGGGEAAKVAGSIAMAESPADLRKIWDGLGQYKLTVAELTDIKAAWSARFEALKVAADPGKYDDVGPGEWDDGEVDRDPGE